MSNAYHRDHGGPSTRDGRPLGFSPPPTPDVARLRAKARQVKDAQGLSIQDLVLATGLSRTAIMDMLNGRGRISVGRIDTWWALAWGLNIPFAELMGVLDDTGADTAT